MFDMTMPDLVDFLPLTNVLKATLCGRSSPFTGWLELAAQFEIDIRDKKFWQDSLAVIGKRIDRYCEL